LRDFFIRHKEEVIGVGIFEFDEELYQEAMREDVIEIGKEIGRKEGKELGQKEGRAQGEELFARLTAVLTKARRYKDLEKAIEDKQYRSVLYKKYHLQ